MMNIPCWPDLEWRIEPKLVPYEEALAQMEARAIAIRQTHAPGLIWMVEHPPLYTAGTSAKPHDLINPHNLPVFKAGRGGQYTHHAPGQRIVYVMVDLLKWQQDVRAYVCALEKWIMLSLAQFGLESGRRSGRIGIWVETQDQIAGTLCDAKIAAIGVRLKKWVSLHGIAINVDIDLSGYDGIIPCGLDPHEYGVTSLKALGIDADMARVDHHLKATFKDAFLLG
ncbi:MAG: lipoyl(octanoyl) transferase LipB [Alphaproteobacteria bacterium]